MFPFTEKQKACMELSRSDNFKLRVCIRTERFGLEVDSAVLGERLDLMFFKLFSNLVDSTVL